MPFNLKKFGQDFGRVVTGVNPKDFEEVDLQESFFSQLIDYSIERGYLNEISEKDKIISEESLEKLAQTTGNKMITWLQINRLPVNPSNSEDYDLLSRWQGTLSALHSWGQKVIFLLMRMNGETNLFLGTVSPNANINAEQAADQMKQATFGTMPGIDIDILKGSESVEKINKKLLGLSSIGSVTGIPAFRKQIKFGSLQTLDSLAFGIKDKHTDKDFALVVIAEPMSDTDISNAISAYRSMGNDIHSFVKKTVSASQSQSSSTNISIGLGTIISKLMECAGKTSLAFATGGASIAADIMAKKLTGGKALGAAVGSGVFISRGYSESISQGINTEYLNKFAQYAEELIDEHVERMKKGRNLGFWNTGVYVLGKTQREVNTVMGLLRTIYSGDESYIEPIRIHNIKNNEKNPSGALDAVRLFELIPLSGDGNGVVKEAGWHPLGRQFEFLSTPLNTEELSLSTSLPRKDVPGLRFVKTSVRFANNPAIVDEGDVITLGNVIDTGIIQNNTYRIDPNSLVRHALVSGTTGTGKSTTSRRIVTEVSERETPVLIIEPAKDEYVRWAIAYNAKIDNDMTIPQEKKRKMKFRIYMPGVKELEGYHFDELTLNPFEPAAIKGAPIDMLSRCEQLVAILNASLPTSDVLPIIIDEAVYKYLDVSYGDEFKKGEMEQKDWYVKLEGIKKIAAAVLANRGYDKKVQDDLNAALETRFEYLLRGKRGDILNVAKSVDYNELFNNNVVINLSKVKARKDNALIMAIIMLSLYEYRVSQYTYDPQYRAAAKKNKLMHLAVIEEAHNLLSNPQVDFSRSGDAQIISSEMFSDILAEIREYGQGIMIVDQVPTKLIPDAIKNTNYKIVHRLVSPDDAAIMAASLSLRGEQKELISSLAIGEAIICGDMDDAAAWVKIKR